MKKHSLTFIFLILIALLSLVVLCSCSNSSNNNSNDNLNSNLDCSLNSDSSSNLDSDLNTDSNQEQSGSNDSSLDEDPNATKGLEFVDLGDGTYGVAKGSATYHSSVVIPIKHNGKPVTKIIADGFKNCTELSSITIPASIISIGDSAFYGCTKLAEIDIPNGVVSIGNSAFQGCTKLTEFSAPDSVVSIGDNAFRGCTSLETVIIPNGAAEIGTSVFYSCKITSATVPAYVVNQLNNSVVNLVVTGGGSIQKAIFSNSRCIKSLIIKGDVTSIEERAFRESSLETLEIDCDNLCIGAHAFNGCTNLTSVTMHKGVKSIGMYAFYECKYLNKITLNDDLISIDSLAFEKCFSLKSIVIPRSVETMGFGVFRISFYNDEIPTKIYCEATEQPKGWDQRWNEYKLPVVWGYTGE